MADQGLKNHIRLFTYQPVHVSNIEQLAGLGLQTTLLPHADAVPPLVPGDVVLLNTTGFTPNVKNAIFSALERGVVKKLFWYVHEDLPERIFSAAETAMIRRLSAEGKVVVSTQSRRACQRYARHFGMEILLEPARVDLPAKYHLVRDAADFETLRFIMPGTFLDGRKGQHTILYALATFYRQYFAAAAVVLSRVHPELRGRRGRLVFEAGRPPPSNPRGSGHHPPQDHPRVVPGSDPRGERQHLLFPERDRADLHRRGHASGPSDPPQRLLGRG